MTAKNWWVRHRSILIKQRELQALTESCYSWQSHALNKHAVHRQTARLPPTALIAIDFTVALAIRLPVAAARCRPRGGCQNWRPIDRSNSATFRGAVKGTVTTPWLVRECGVWYPMSVTVPSQTALVCTSQSKDVTCRQKQCQGDMGKSVTFFSSTARAHTHFAKCSIIFQSYKHRQALSIIFIHVHKLPGSPHHKKKLYGPVKRAANIAPKSSSSYNFPSDVSLIKQSWAESLCKHMTSRFAQVCRLVYIFWMEHQ